MKVTMGRLFKRTIVFSLVLFFLTIFLPFMHLNAADESPNRQINVVYDDSGSMYDTSGPVDTWCQAKYAMEVFAAMLGDKDTMNIYYMSDYQLGTASGPRLVLYGKDGASSNVTKLHNEKTTAGNTPFDSVRKAYSDLSQMSADEKWLVVLTDGAFEDGAFTSDMVDAFLAAKDSDIKVLFLAMGPWASGITNREDQNIIYKEAKTNGEILHQLTGICTRVFNSNRLEVNITSKSFSFDVPMGELVVFAQGANVNIGGIQQTEGKTFLPSLSPVEVKYSECDAQNYQNQPTTDLKGSIVTFTDDFPAGDYNVEVSGAETIEIFYKPNVEVAAYLTDASGTEVTNFDNLEAGEYALNFGFVKAGTKEKVVQSQLLGEVSYEAYVTNNGVLLERSFVDGDKIRLEEGNLQIDVTARYLEYNSVSTHLDYSVFKNKPVDFKVVKDSTFVVSSKGLEGEPVTIEAMIDGHSFSNEQWEMMGLPNVKYTETERSFKINAPTIEKAQEVGKYVVYVSLPEGKPSTGSYNDCAFELSYQQKIGSETWSGSMQGNIHIEDNRNFIEKYWDWMLRGLVALVILGIAFGFIPGIKKYLSKSLQKEPFIKCTPKVPGQVPRVVTGEAVKGIVSTILPYAAQRAEIRYMPKGMGGVPLKVKAVKNRQMRITNIKDYVNKDNIRFMGSSIRPDNLKKNTFSAGLNISVETATWAYSCSLNQGKNKKTKQGKNKKTKARKKK